MSREKIVSQSNPILVFQDSIRAILDDLRPIQVLADFEEQNSKIAKNAINVLSAIGNQCNKLLNLQKQDEENKQIIEENLRNLKYIYLETLILLQHNLIEKGNTAKIQALKSTILLQFTEVLRSDVKVFIQKDTQYVEHELFNMLESCPDIQNSTENDVIQFAYSGSYSPRAIELANDFNITKQKAAMGCTAAAAAGGILLVAFSVITGGAAIAVAVVALLVLLVLPGIYPFIRQDDLKVHVNKFNQVLTPKAEAVSSISYDLKNNAPPPLPTTDHDKTDKQQGTEDHESQKPEDHIPYLRFMR